MHSHRRSRGKVAFEALCGLALAASFAAASGQTGAPALLASAAVMALASIYWAFGLLARDRTDVVEQPSSVVAVAPPVEVEPAVREEVFALEPEAAPEPKPVAKAPKKPRARKTKKAAADAVPVLEQAEPAPYADSAYQGVPLEPLFEPQPFARQPRAFGRKSRRPGNLSAA